MARRAAWTDDFVDIEGDAKPRPALRTRAKMLWDDTYFYVGAELVEPHLWATLTEHDAVIFHDNDFEVFIDPNGDNHEYYEFEINALGTTWDLLLPRPYKDGGKPVNSWEIPGMKSAVHLDGTLNDPRDADRAWSVELAFPWTVLGELARRPAPPVDGDQWRVNFSRVEWPLEIVGRRLSQEGRTRARPTGCGRRSTSWTCIAPRRGATSSSRQRGPDRRRSCRTRRCPRADGCIRCTTRSARFTRRTGTGRQRSRNCRSRHPRTSGSAPRR